MSIFKIIKFISVSLCTDLLPKNKPIYCMGVGYTEDLIVCSALGVDMYDCVFPTRTAVCDTFEFSILKYALPLTKFYYHSFFFF